jgi:hypothetical protein
MELDRTQMWKMAWDIWDLTNKLRFMGYDLTTEKARNKGQYTINEIASTGDREALRTNTNEFDDAKYHNALYHIAEVRNVIRNLDASMEWCEKEIAKASGQEPITIKS